MNIENIKNNLSVNQISFVFDTSKNVNIDKKGKAYYYKMFGLNLDSIKNFVYNIRDNDVILINAFISTNCRYDYPNINLSKQFLITNKSSPVLLSNHLHEQIEKVICCFNFRRWSFYCFIWTTWIWWNTSTCSRVSNFFT